jgi:hypothetical protein
MTRGGANPSTYPEDATVIESDPVRIIHRGRLHVHIPAHTRGGIPVKAHWRPMPHGMASPTNAEPVELFGGRTS